MQRLGAATARLLDCRTRPISSADFTFSSPRPCTCLHGSFLRGGSGWARAFSNTRVSLELFGSYALDLRRFSSTVQPAPPTLVRHLLQAPRCIESAAGLLLRAFHF